MTDITELAQRMKAAAVRAKTATEEYASGHMSVSVCFAECEEFNRLTDGPDNIIVLVEALEKAQQRIGKLEKKLTDHKRMNQEMAKAMLTPNDSDAAGMEIAALRQRIAELEREQEHLRPVGVMSEQAFHRLENSECRFIALWPRPGIFLQRKRPEDGVLVYARTAAAAGIKVEAE
ncbi:hypothetical protein SQ57_24645 [Klebsiella pneumoniae]|uniref:hypothetical protein n=1 Tax=Klebsiella pneumoniae TaxID=573 RepID=UPI000788B4F5|nr:hypothetical protein [Klebsiella pneumoniae]KYL73749.1 hypothetical protein SQ57_24645 [Klebsiella pneumoniae]MDP0741061.1 ead/Ea22-like family protein [Klebsiella pneumoniae]VGD69015.1 Uncharacterised protein [Klebsiella pneumoniae]HCM6696237.1 ead/Ea22-like family protein [Klebsiella pneumoniae]HCT6939804.1 ead/Ea22-like family protein [Klebsiella pneumoniae]